MERVSARGVTRPRLNSAARPPLHVGSVPLFPWVPFLSVALAGAVACSCAKAEPPKARAPDVPYEPSPPHVVEAMLELGQVDAQDVVYDLGCGDGRIVIAAVKERGAEGVCVDIDPVRIEESRHNAAQAGVGDRIRFLTQDLFATDLSDATVVMLFLWPKVNLDLRPKLQQGLASGSRIVSHMHDMGDWAADAQTSVLVDGKPRTIYQWTIP